MITVKVVSRDALRALLHARTEIPPGTRCDRCRIANAQTRVTFTTGTVLYMCAHHYREHEPVLETDPNAHVYTQPNPCTCATCDGDRKRKP